MTVAQTLKPSQLVRSLGVVAGGGAAGTLLRDLLVKLDQAGRPSRFVLSGAQLVAVPPSWVSLIPWTLLSVNLVGVYLATRLLRGVLRHRDPNDLGRLVLITGFLGGFTTYSGLFVALAAIWHQSAVGALLVGLGAVTGGVGAAWLGLREWRSK